MNKPTLVGRSSSHFTRVARIFCHELGVEHELRIVGDLMSADAGDYGGNPALKIDGGGSARSPTSSALDPARGR